MAGALERGDWGHNLPPLTAIPPSLIYLISSEGRGFRLPLEGLRVLRDMWCHSLIGTVGWTLASGYLNFILALLLISCRYKPKQLSFLSSRFSFLT